MLYDSPLDSLLECWERHGVRQDPMFLPVSSNSSADGRVAVASTARFSEEMALLSHSGLKRILGRAWRWRVVAF